MEILNISNLSKSFGSRKIIDDLSFSVEENKVFGFIGQNGAGKTTTMKMILGLLKADSGEITVCGEKVKFGQTKTNQFIGYLPDVPEYYGYMTPTEYLILCGDITGIDKKELKQRVEELLSLVGLNDAKKRIHGFSRGMKQRLGIAQALLGRPKLLICDEPTSALDPIGRKEILDILSEVKKETTVIFSTHILSDVERICDEVAFLHDGKIALKGTIEEIRATRKGTDIEIEFFNQIDCDVFFNDFPAAKAIGKTKLAYDKKTEEDILSIMKYLSDNKMAIQRIEMLEPTLEDLFVEVVGK